MPLHRLARTPQEGRDFRDTQSCEDPQLNDLGLLGIFLPELFQILVDPEAFLVVLGDGEINGIQRHPLQPASVTNPVFAPGIIHEDASHRLGGRAEEVSPAAPLLPIGTSHPQPRFMNEGGGLQRLAGPFIGHLVGRQPAQFIIDQGQQFLCSLRITGINRTEQLGDVAGHGAESSQRGTLKPTGEDSLYVRLEVWKDLVTNVIPYRPLGAGLGAGSLGALKFSGINDETAIDNFVLTLAVAVGIPGTLLFVWILGRASVFALRQTRRTSSQTPEATLARIIAALMPVFLLNNFFGLTFSLYAVAPLGWLIIGWLSAQEGQALAAAGASEEPEIEFITRD